MIWVLALGTLHLLGVLSALNAVMTGRTSQGTIAWVIFLVTFPYIALPAYWILGRSRFRGYETAQHSTDDVIQTKLAAVIEGAAPYCLPLTQINSADAVGDRLADFPHTRANAVKLLVDGDATFESILEGIDAAKSYILFQFFIVADDELGRRIQQHLIQKSKEGVRVYFLYDEIGSHKLTASYKGELRKAGVEVRAFHTQKGLRNRFQLNFRNHRKVVVVDGKVTWIGGHNVADEYLGKNPKFGHWRDTHVRVEGPAALAAQLSYVEDWHWASDQYIDGLEWTPIPSRKEDKSVLIVPSGPADSLETAGLMFHHAINMAKERIWITSPYFVPDDAITQALQLAGLRGVDVRILIPDKPDHLLVFLAAYTYFEDAENTGVRFFRYTDGFLHQKVMLIDKDVSGVGTANFDNRSFRLNFEITAIISDTAFSKEIEAMLENDFAHAKEMHKSDIEGKSWWFKLATRVARLTSPVQ